MDCLEGLAFLSDYLARGSIGGFAATYGFIPKMRVAIAPLPFTAF